MHSIIAVVVTYNRCDLLRGCINAVRKQTAKIAEIVVVDNDSSDGTETMLTSEFPDVTYIRMKHNLGGAGGFHIGMKWAYENGANFVWMMDDDGCPAPECLELLLSRGAAGKWDIVGPLVIDVADPERLSFSLAGTKRRADLESGFGEAIEGDLNPFNGTLVNRRVIDRIGLVKGEMFIWGDELEYLYRAKANGLRAATIIAALYHHPQEKQKMRSLLGGKLGRVIDIGNPHARIMFRNVAYNGRAYHGIAYIIGKACTQVLFLLIHGRFAEAIVFFRYYLDGLQDCYNLPPSRDSFRSNVEARIVRRTTVSASTETLANG